MIWIPILSFIVIDIFAIPAMSFEVEQIFFGAKYIFWTVFSIADISWYSLLAKDSLLYWQLVTSTQPVQLIICEGEIGMRLINWKDGKDSVSVDMIINF